MSLLTTISGWLAALGGVITLVVLIGTWWHNRKMREFSRRQAEALEKMVGEGRV